MSKSNTTTGFCTFSSYRTRFTDGINYNASLIFWSQNYTYLKSAWFEKVFFVISTTFNLVLKCDLWICEDIWEKILRKQAQYFLFETFLMTLLIPKYFANTTYVNDQIYVFWDFLKKAWMHWFFQTYIWIDLIAH